MCEICKNRPMSKITIETPDGETKVFEVPHFVLFAGDNHGMTQYINAGKRLIIAAHGELEKIIEADIMPNDEEISEIASDMAEAFASILAGRTGPRRKH